MQPWAWGCPRVPTTPLQRVWIALRASERAVLETVTLVDIVSGELPPSVAALTDNPQAWV